MPCQLLCFSPYFSLDLKREDGRLGLRSEGDGWGCVRHPLKNSWLAGQGEGIWGAGVPSAALREKGWVSTQWKLSEKIRSCTEFEYAAQNPKTLGEETCPVQQERGASQGLSAFLSVEPLSLVVQTWYNWKSLPLLNKGVWLLVSISSWENLAASYCSSGCTLNLVGQNPLLLFLVKGPPPAGFQSLQIQSTLPSKVRKRNQEEVECTGYFWLKAK